MAITDEIKLEAELVGREWGAQEVALWHDQRPGEPMPEWTMGAYCGRLPGVTDRDEQQDLADEVDLTIDRAAREVWNAAMVQQS